MDTKTLLLLSVLLASGYSSAFGPCCSAECCCSSCPRATCVSSSSSGVASYDATARRDQCSCLNTCRRGEISVQVHAKLPDPAPQQPVQVVHNVAVYQDKKDDCCAKSGNSCDGNCGNSGFCSTCSFSWGYIFASPLLIGLCIAIVVVIFLICITACCLMFSLCFPSSGSIFRRRRPSTFEVIHEEETTEYSRGGGQRLQQRSSEGSDSQQRQHRFS